VAHNWQIVGPNSTWDWTQAAALPPFTLADGSGLAQQQTVARICYNEQALFVRFDCEDTDIWGNYTQRDDPIYDEEVVEVFIGVGEQTPVDYYEFEVSPNGVLLDLTVHNPTSQRAELQTDFAWDCPGLLSMAGREDIYQRWWAILAIPWASIGAAAPPAKFWRANFYRIERPHGREPEFSCWSPTMTNPADYHKPAYFGLLELG
jgi:hypothetical protein